MITFPNAKINIGLNIVAKRHDGYHNIETVFYPISLCDVLEVVSGEGANLFSTIGELDCVEVEDNLIYKAYAVLAQDHVVPPFSAYLKKDIPTGAGLGGGSADAACMIKMLNEHAALGLSNEEMECYASRIGADCAFFIQNKPTFAQGIGNEFSSLGLDLRGYHLLLVKPRVHVSTKEAYAHTVPLKWDVPLDVAIRKPIGEWKYYIFNDFEKSVFIEHPELEEVKRELYREGALYASMSGSGSSIYGVFERGSEEPNFEVDNLEGKYWLELS